jgi:hypothetical protein
MAVTLNQRAYAQAQRLVDNGWAVRDERDAWSEHRPSAQQENDFIAEHGWRVREVAGRSDARSEVRCGDPGRAGRPR